MADTVQMPAEGEEPLGGSDLALRILSHLQRLDGDLSTLRSEQRATAAELQRLLQDMGQRSERSAREVSDAVRGELAGELHRVAEDISEVRKSTGSLESGVGESKAALVELVEYDRQRRRNEERERERAEREERSRRAAEMDKVGRQHLRAGRLEEAIAALRDARQLDEENAVLLSDLGAALLAAGRLDPSEEPLRRAVRTDAACAPARTNLGHLLLMRGDLDEALKHLEEAVKLDPSSGAAWNNLGNARWRTGAYPDAVEAWQRAWANDPLCDAAGANLRRQQEIEEQ